MTPKSIPSGALKVAELVAEVRYHLDHGLGNMRVFEKACAALNELAALASPSPATGALKPLTDAEVDDIAEAGGGYQYFSQCEFARAIEAAHGITAATQVEPEDKHG